jgi:hypothetical protein
MKRMKYKQLVIGVLLGSMITGAGAAAASQSTAITAFLKDGVTFKFNGDEKKLKDGYSVLNYNNSTYVPARFVAEELGAKVTWDNDTQTISVNTIDDVKESAQPVLTKPNQPETKPNETKPNSPAGDWDKYDGVWNSASGSITLDFVSATQAGVELTSTDKPEFNGLTFTVDYTSGVGIAEVSIDGDTYAVSLATSPGSIVLTMVNKTTRVVYNVIYSGSTPLPTPPSSGGPSNGTPAGNTADYQGKWTKTGQSLTLSFSSTTATVVYDNTSSTGLPDFTADLRLGTTSAAGQFIKGGQTYLVQVTLGTNQVTLTVISVADGTYSTEIFTTKD